MKNLHHGVSLDDLRAVFDSVQQVTKRDGDGDTSQDDDGVEEEVQTPPTSPHIRLMTGRMRGQGFVEFPCE